MKNFIAELLIKLAEKEDETKELTLQIKALEIIVAGLLKNIEQEQRLIFINNIETSLESLYHGTSTARYDHSELKARLLLIQHD